jgi:hypothetical protein
LGSETSSLKTVSSGESRGHPVPVGVRVFDAKIPHWETRFDVHILDPIITEQIFREMLAIGGMFKGIGRYRPANRGTNGRYEIADLMWRENRRFAA